MRNIISAAAFAAGTLIAAGSAFAGDVRVTGVPLDPHRGVNNYAFSVNGRSYVLPMTGFGALEQAIWVDTAYANNWTISFLANCDNMITYHTGATGCYAHDID